MKAITNLHIIYSKPSSLYHWRIMCVLIMPSVTVRDTHCYKTARYFQSFLSLHLFEYFIWESVIEISWCFSIWSEAVLHLTAYL